MTGYAERQEIREVIHCLPILPELSTADNVVDTVTRSSAYLAFVVISLKCLHSLFFPIRAIVMIVTARPIWMIGTPTPEVETCQGAESSVATTLGRILKWFTALFAGHGRSLTNMKPGLAESVDVRTRGGTKDLTLPPLVKLVSAFRADKGWLGITNSHTCLGTIRSPLAWDITELLIADGANVLNAWTLAWTWLRHVHTSKCMFIQEMWGRVLGKRLSVGSYSTLAPSLGEL